MLCSKSESNISDGSNISHSSSSLASPDLAIPLVPLALALTTAHPLLHLRPSCFQILPALEVKNQRSNNEEEKEKNKEDYGKKNTSCTESVLIIILSVFLCFAADLCATLAEAERT